MGLYFYCPGETQASSTTVVCSVPLESYTPDPGFLSAHTVDTFGPFVFLFFAIIFGTSQIKRAIEQ